MANHPEQPDEAETQEPAELARRFFAAADRSDYGAMMSLFAADAVWDASCWGLGIREGHASISRFIEDWIGSFEHYAVTTDEVLDLGGGVVCAVVSRSALAVGGRGRLTLQDAVVFVWREGRIASMRNHADVEQGRAAAERLAGRGRAAIGQAATGHA